MKTRLNLCSSMESLPALPVKHHREKTADQEEQRHAKAVRRGKEPREDHIRLVILNDPGRCERHGRVQRDAQKHGKGPQGVQVMPPCAYARSWASMAVPSVAALAGDSGSSFACMAGTPWCP